MSTNFKFPDFISTYQKVLLSDWPAIAKLIFKHSALLKDGGYREEDFESSPTNVLSERQISDATNGPYSAFFHDKIAAFAKFGRIRMGVHIDNQDSIKDHLSHINKADELTSRQLEHFPPEEITRLQDAFDELVTDHAQQWEGQLFFWQMSITGALRESGLEITEMESDEFSAPEPISELLARYDAVNVTPAKVAYPLNFADYFRLKAYLTILSALSRQHLPNDEKSIDGHMKALKKALSDISKAEAQLRKQQQSEIDELLP